MTDEVKDPLTAPPQASGSRWRLAFLILLGLNLAGAGLMAGAMWRNGGPRGGMVKELGFGPFSEALSREDKAALRRGFFERMPNLREARQEMQADVAAITAALRAVPFDKARLETALDGFQSRMRDRMALGRTLIVDRIVAMTDAERAGFADRLQEAASRGPGGPKDGPDAE